ncbi:hypothetical protein Taro_002686 [Colocasia esculenta]|uniref:Uncharacterized protein n=1 Tax=Colocasia esculenta TaxID=4460 RepID=A0A843TLJ6_COLES|nr:hypothetical protein [Colocasia esculenta]
MIAGCLLLAYLPALFIFRKQ